MASRLSLRNETSAVRRATNVSLDARLVQTAREYGINVSRACEEGLARQVADERDRRWQEENREAIDCYNAYIAKHGLPLAKYCTF